LILSFGACEQAPYVDFASEIQPLLNKHCITCHGGVKKSGGISFLFQQEAFAVGESGLAAIVPGNAEASEMFKRLTHHDPEIRMPFEKPALSEPEIALIKRWINQGAGWGKHWAYRPLTKVKVPQINSKSSKTEVPKLFVQNDIDRFILAKLQEQGLAPKMGANKEIIIRRLALDLTGLPPKQDWHDSFLAGTMTYSNLVDTLLSQKSFGEKWASWWLDLARYADSKGYEKDNGRQIWRFRDWVIDAFNSDMPFDEFTRLQLAGDLIPQTQPNQLIATAFHRNTMNNDEGGTEDEEFRIASVLDRVNTTYQVWQSTTMECVQCHTHTYDPIRHDEYYKSMAFFNNTMDEDTPDEDPVLKFYTPEDQETVAAILKWNQKHDSSGLAKRFDRFLTYNEPIYQVHHAKNFIKGELSDTKYLSLWPGGSCYYENIDTKDATNLYLKYRAYFNGTVMTLRKDSPQGKILARFNIDKTEGEIIRKIPIEAVNGPFKLYFQAENSMLPEQAGTSYITWFAFLPDLPGKGNLGYERMVSDFERLLNTPTETVPILLENPDYMARTTRIFERGNWLTLTDTVTPATPEILNAWNDSLPKNRLGFAYWLTSPENPLTARTVVNRIWHQLFGNGLVTTLEDMGSQSDPPTHPELLDWLSLELMQKNSWHLKALIRSIVHSGTYRQSAEAPTSEYTKDPKNLLYARGPRQRLSAEQIRDQALAVSGLLSSKMYGPSVMPPQPEGVWQTVYSNESWRESSGEDKYRRGLYTYIKRTSPYPSFLSFDAGSREVCTIRRTVTNTPLQALVTLNDPVYLEAAYHLAEQMLAQEDVKNAIAFGYKKALFRNIAPGQEDALYNLYVSALENFTKNPEDLEDFIGLEQHPNPKLAALTVVVNAIMNLDAFITTS
jgi:hypothetical protein